MRPNLVTNRIIAVLILVIAALLFWYFPTPQNIFFETALFFEQYSAKIPVVATVLFIVLAALSAMIAPFSSVPFVPIAVVIWGGFLTFILLLGGWVIGGAISYFIGRHIGYPLVKKIISEDKIIYYRGKIPPKSEFVLLLLFRLVMPAEIPGYLLGMIEYHFGKYLLITFLAELPFALIIVYASEAFLLERKAAFWSLIIAAAVLFLSLFYLFHKGLKRSS